MLIQELVQINEASHARRAWDGKLEKIDKLMAWMYDKGILTKGEQSKKDRIFRSYYRYYNDGDMPAALKNRGFDRYSPKPAVEKALEEYLEDFIKSMLAKYLPKVDRTAFRIDSALKELRTVISVAKDDDIGGLLSYWIKKVKISDQEESNHLSKLVDELNEKFDALKAELNEASPKTSNYTIKYRIEQMKEEGTWTTAFEKDFNAALKINAEIVEFLEKLRDSLMLLKR